MTCPECGHEIKGLGKCWECGHDTRAGPKKAPTPKLSEDEIQRQVRDLLALHGFDYVDTSQAQKAQITRGLADILVFGDGRFLMAEIKGPDGRQSPHQKKVEAWCRRANVEYRIWRSVDDALAWIEDDGRAA